MSSLLDTDSQRENIRQAVESSIKQAFPIEGQHRRLELEDVWVADEKDPLNFPAQKKAKLAGRSYATPVYASVKLVDAQTGKVLDKVERLKLGELPVFTSRASFIVKGSEYQVTNQLRLRPGVYTRAGADGILSSHFNMEKGRGFKLWLDQENGLFNMEIGTANIRLYPILRDLGLSDSQIESAWGPEVLRINQEKSAGVADTEINKLYKKLFYGETSEDRDTAISKVREYFKDRTKTDPEITEFTLGRKHEILSPDLLLDASRKLLAVSRAEEPEDDKDHLGFKSIHSVDDFLSERLSKMSQKIKDDLSRNIDRLDKRTIPEILSKEAFHKPIETLFTKTQLSSTPEQINPLHMVGGLQKVTVFGEGGVSEKALTAEARGVHPSHLAMLDPLQTPESGAVGAMFRLPTGARKDGSVLRTVVYDPLTAKEERMSARELHDKVLAFPAQFQLNDKGTRFETDSKLVKAQHQGRIVEVPPAKVDYVLPTPRTMFGLSVNMMPFLDSDQGNRALTASRMQEQALPLVAREEPLVQTHMSRAGSYEMGIPRGFHFAAFAPVSGKITKVDEEAGEVHVAPEKGKAQKVFLYKNFPLNAQHFLDSEMRVKVGDQVEKGQLLADTNYTKNGRLALGTNLTVAYLPYRGYNFEDGVVVSETAAQKLTSSHMYTESAESGPDVLIDRTKFIAYFPSKFTSAQLSSIDPDGVIKVGSKVSEGDPLILSLSRATARPEDGILTAINRSLVRPYRDTAVTWAHTVPGVVTDVARHGNTVTVYARAEEPATVGDKIAGRHGNKGIIVKILPDAEMPRTADGQASEVLMNPHGVPSRINLGQLLETAVGKVAAKTGQPILVKNFEPGSNLERVQDLLKKNGLADTEELFDGQDGKSIGRVNIGRQFIMKLDHSVAKKFHARDTGGYTADDLPGKGDHSSSQAIDPLLFYSLISHGARENLHEMATIKATKNDEFWRAYQTGQRLPPPRPSFAFEKFTNMLKGLGVNVEKKGHSVSLIPMTDADVGKMSSGEIQSGKLLKTRGLSDLVEEKGGLFDPRLTGGHSGNKWAHIQLADPIPNPVFEDAIKTVLDLRQPEFDGLLTGKLAVAADGVVVPSDSLPVEKRLVGGAAVKALLGRVDVEAQLKDLRASAVGTKGQELNTLNKRIRYLSALKNNNLDPTVYVTSRVPVLPPKFRPIYPTDNGQLVTSDVNLLYKDLILANDALKEQKALGFPGTSLGETTAHVYNQYKLLAGLGGEATSTTSVRTPKGLVETITGLGSPKSGFFQSKLVRRKQDLSARSTVVPEPALNVDEIGLPLEMLQTIFRKPVIKRLVGLGYSPLQAQDEIDKGSQVARKALDLETESRNVMMNRAPSLHKFSMMAFKPRVVPGQAVRVHPLVVKGLNMDFDGDTAAIHVPVTPAAMRETQAMLPTNNLFNPGTGELMMVPGQEAVLGLYKLTEQGRATRKKYQDFEAARAAVKSGEINATDVVSIGGQRTTVGRMTVNMVLPEPIRDLTAQFDKKQITNALAQVAQQFPSEFGSVADGLKDLGNEHAYRSGSTISLSDLEPQVSGREAILKPVRSKVKELDLQLARTKDPTKREALEAQKVELYTRATDSIGNLVRQLPRTNNVRRMVDAGARGNYTQVRQMIVAPMLLTGTGGEIVPIPVTKSYAEGLDPADYWLQAYGARTGVVDRSLQTSVPGYFQKRLINTMINLTVTQVDCGTRNGVELKLDDPDALDRYTAGDRFGIQRNTVIGTGVLATYRKNGASAIKVRSPMTCEAKEGVCAKCFGKRETGTDSPLGDNVGALSAQAIAEPATQMQMRTFHTGGVASGGIGSNLKSGFNRILQLTELPATIRGSSTLAEEEGSVEKIEGAPAGGSYIYVAGRRHYVPASNRVLVEVGQTVERGAPLSDGEQNPHDILRLRGMGATRSHLVTELKNEYRAQGIRLKPSILESAVRGLTNLTRVLDPGDSDFAPGDYAPLSAVEAEVKAGTKIVHRPELKGINQAPLFGNEDWLSQLNFQNLKKTILNAATKNWSSDIHGTNPVAAWVYGAEFGRGEAPGVY